MVHDQKQMAVVPVGPVDSHCIFSSRCPRECSARVASRTWGQMTSPFPWKHCLFFQRLVRIGGNRTAKHKNAANTCNTGNRHNVRGNWVTYWLASRRGAVASCYFIISMSRNTAACAIFMQMFLTLSNNTIVAPALHIGSLLKKQIILRNGAAGIGGATPGNVRNVE